MKQLGRGLNLSTKKKRKREFLEEMDRVVPWAALVEIVQPHYPRPKTGRPPYALETMLRVHYLQQWFGLSDPAMEEALNDVHFGRKAHIGVDAVSGAERIEQLKASVRAKAEHPFHVLKRQFGFAKVPYRGLAKNTAQIQALFALASLWMARRHLMGALG